MRRGKMLVERRPRSLAHELDVDRGGRDPRSRQRTQRLEFIKKEKV